MILETLLLVMCAVSSANGMGDSMGDMDGGCSSWTECEFWLYDDLINATDDDGSTVYNGTRYTDADRAV